MLDISNLGLGDIVIHKKLGQGHVIACTEKPSITVKFDGKTKVFTQANEQELEDNTQS